MVAPGNAGVPLSAAGGRGGGGGKMLSSENALSSIEFTKIVTISRVNGVIVIGRFSARAIILLEKFYGDRSKMLEFQVEG